jgi:hypothetical protein
MRDGERGYRGNVEGGGGKESDAKKKKDVWSEDELDEAEAGVRVFGTLMYAEDGEATETKAFKKAKAQEAAALNAAKPAWQQVRMLYCVFALAILLRFCLQKKRDRGTDRVRKKHSACLSVHRTVRLYVGANRRRRWARRKYSIARVARGCTERSQEGFLPGISIQWVRRRDGRLPHLYPRGATERRLLNNVPRTLWMLKTLQRKQPGESRYLK